MEENFNNEEMQEEIRDFSAEISEQQSRIIQAQSILRDTDTDAITAALGYLCGETDKTRVEELYATRRDLMLEIADAKRLISEYEEQMA